MTSLKDEEEDLYVIMNRFVQPASPEAYQANRLFFGNIIAEEHTVSVWGMVGRKLKESGIRG